MSNTTDLIKTLDGSLTTLMSKVDVVEKKAYEVVLSKINKLQYKSGRLLQNTANVKVIGEMKGALNNLLRSPSYISAIKTFGKEYDVVEKIQNDYFSAIVEDFKPGGAANITKHTAIRQMVDNLVGGGVNQAVTENAANILLRNMQSGSNVRELTEELRNFMLTTSESAGALSKYSGQIATDSINQFAAAYNEQVTEDLGFEWFQYVGSLRDTSRDFCEALISQRYIHKSEFSKAAKGVLRNVTVSTAGMYKQTNANNLTVLRGGYNCKHQFRGVATGTVPQSVRDQVEGTQNVFTPAKPGRG